jgi:hypothetical protein
MGALLMDYMKITGRSGNVGAPTQNRLFFIFWLNRAKFDRACECRANGPARVQHGPAWSRTSSMRDLAGHCWTLLDIAGPLLDHAGHLREFAGHCGTTWTLNYPF